MGLEMNKKGMFFSIAVTGLIIMVLISLNFENKKDIDVTHDYSVLAVVSMQKFIDDTLNDFDRAFYIAIYRTILSANEYITSQQDFLSNQDLFTLTVNGTINNNIINLSASDNLNDWKKSINTIAKDFKIDFNATFNNIEAYHSSPWYLNFKINVTFNFYSQDKKTNFTFDQIRNTKISIIGFEDPFYSYYSKGTSFSNINKSQYFLDELYGNENKIDEFALKGFYIENDDAPSFLNRIYGNFSSDKNGIERMINVEELNSEFYINSSIIDHLYWQGESQNYLVKNSSLYWLRLDEQHLNYYGLEKN